MYSSETWVSWSARILRDRRVRKRRKTSMSDSGQLNSGQVTYASTYMLSCYVSLLNAAFWMMCFEGWFDVLVKGKKSGLMRFAFVFDRLIDGSCEIKSRFRSSFRSAQKVYSLPNSNICLSISAKNDQNNSNISLWVSRMHRLICWVLISFPSQISDWVPTSSASFSHLSRFCWHLFSDLQINPDVEVRIRLRKRHHSLSKHLASRKLFLRLNHLLLPIGLFSRTEWIQGPLDLSPCCARAQFSLQTSSFASLPTSVQIKSSSSEGYPRCG